MSTAKSIAFALLMVLVARPVAAQTASYGVDVGYLIAGGSALKGAQANPTGGVTIVPFLRVSAPIPGVDWLDVSYTQSPMIVTPVSLDRLGIVDANDLGLSVHSELRAVEATLAGTLAPARMQFCNMSWCLTELTVMYGGELHASALVSADVHGRTLRVGLTARLLYAQPTAWTWEGLTPRERAVIPTTAMLQFGGISSF